MDYIKIELQKNATLFLFVVLFLQQCKKKSPESLAGHKKVFNLKKIKSKTILLQTWWHSCQF